MSYLVHLKHFEGPMALLLYLIRKEEMDIFDIDIHQITQQYLDYIRMMKELDLEVAGEFIAMAATLIHIKSRMLLPQYNDEGDLVEHEDPRKELVQKLLEYQRFQQVGKQIYARPLLRRDVWGRGAGDDFMGEVIGDIEVEENPLFSLISSYRRAIRNMQKAVHKVRGKVQSIANRVMEIKDRLVVGQRVRMQDLLTIGPGFRTQVLVTFLSLLELGRMGFVSLFQNEVYGDIHIEALRPIERNVLERVQEFDSADAEAVAAQIMNEAADEQGEAVVAGEVGDQLSLVDDGMAIASVPETPQETESLLAQFFAAEGTTDLGEEILEANQIASDEEILQAEAELTAVPEGSLPDGDIQT